MFYDAHFIVDVTNWSRGIWLDGTTQIMDMEDILLSDRLAPSCLHSPDRSDAVEEAWSWFCGRIREIPDSVIV